MIWAEANLGLGVEGRRCCCGGDDLDSLLENSQGLEGLAPAPLASTKTAICLYV